MSKVIVDEGLRTKLQGMTGELALCDESGQVLGHYLPAEMYRKFLYAVAAAEINLESSVAANNTSAGIRSEGALAVVRMSNVSTIDNGAGMASIGGGQLISFGNNRNAGNSTAGAPTSTVPQQ